MFAILRGTLDRSIKIHNWNRDIVLTSAATL